MNQSLHLVKTIEIQCVYLPFLSQKIRLKSARADHQPSREVQIRIYRTNDNNAMWRVRLIAWASFFW